MVLGPNRPLTNDLLDRLPARDRKAVVAACDEVEVVLGELIYAEGGRIPYAYFPIDSMFSELSPSASPAVEAFLTGHEGMVGFALALDARFAPMECSVQGSGQALRMKAAVFRDFVESMPSLREQAFASALYQMQQTARNVYCVRHHEIQHRLARWLLMGSDRHRSPRFDVTHKFLAAMLGTRRAGVTVAAAGLQARRLIRYRRGEVEILDRQGLEHAACDCYAFSLKAHGAAFRR